jgi:hypothetical protein
MSLSGCQTLALIMDGALVCALCAAVLQLARARKRLRKHAYNARYYLTRELVMYSPCLSSTTIHLPLPNTYNKILFSIVPSVVPLSCSFYLKPSDVLDSVQSSAFKEHNPPHGGVFEIHLLSTWYTVHGATDVTPLIR